MKSEDVASFFVYLLMLGLALALGLTIVKDAVSTLGIGGLSFLLVGLAIVGTILINAIFLELFHGLGGIIGGYKVVSINILGFCWYKNLGKTKFRFSLDFDGLTGETVLAPKSEKAKPHMFVWLPFLMFLVELVGCVVLYSMGSIKGADPKMEYVGAIAVVVITISSMMALYNFIPVKLDTTTDGYRLTLISKPANVEAYNELMRIENLQREGKEIDKVKYFEEITNFTASINLITVYEHLSRKEFDKALKLIDKMCETPDKISKTTLNRLIAQKLYIKILTMPLEEAEKYYDDEVGDDIRRFISNDLSMESLRAYVLIAGMLDKSFGEVQYAASRKAKAMKRALASRAEIEEKLYKDALVMVKEAHKDWDIKID